MGKISLSDYIERVKNHLPNISTENRIWLLRANGGEYYQDFYMNNFVAIGWNQVTLKMLDELNDQDLKQKVNEDDDENKRPGAAVNQMKTFVNDVSINDLVIVPSSAPNNNFLVGKIISDSYTETDQEILTNDRDFSYKKCGYMKRRTVQWIGVIQNEDIDSRLYKLVYSGHTITNADEYRNFINRGLFDSYVVDDQMSITFKVKQESDISAFDYSNFIYSFSNIYHNFDPNEDLTIKTNVQSLGPIEFIGALAVIIPSVIAIARYGFNAGGSVKFKDLEINFGNNEKEKADAKYKAAQTKQLEEETRTKKIHNDLLENLVNTNQISAKDLEISLPQKIEKALEDTHKELLEENIDTIDFDE